MILKTVQAIQNLVEAMSGEEPIPVKTNVEALKQLYAVRGGQDDVSNISLIPDIIQKIAANEQKNGGVKWIPVSLEYKNPVQGCTVRAAAYDLRPIGYVPAVINVANLQEKTVYVPCVSGKGLISLQIEYDPEQYDLDITEYNAMLIDYYSYEVQETGAKLQFHFYPQ